MVIALCSPFGSFTWFLNCCQSSTQKTLPRLKLTPRKRSLKYRFGNWHQLCVKSRQLGADTIVFHSIYYKNIGKMAFQPHAILDRIFGHHQRDQKLFLLQKGLGATRQRCWKKMLFWNKCQVQWLTYKQCFLYVNNFKGKIENFIWFFHKVSQSYYSAFFVYDTFCHTSVFDARIISMLLWIFLPSSSLKK